MKIHYIITAVLVMSGVILGLTTYMNSLEEPYEDTVDFSGLEGTKEKLNRTVFLLQNTTNTISNMKLKASITTLFDIPYAMYQVGWNSVALVFNSWDVVETMIQETIEGFGVSGIDIPDWVSDLFVGFILLAIVASSIYAFFKWKWSDS